MEFKATRRSTYERNKKAGKFEVISEDANGATVRPKEVRGNYCNEPNTHGRTLRYTFTLTLEEVKAQDAAAHRAMMDRIKKGTQS